MDYRAMGVMIKSVEYPRAPWRQRNFKSRKGSYLSGLFVGVCWKNMREFRIASSLE
jgi:hypothetical protein